MNYNGSVIQEITLDVSRYNPIAPILVKQKDAYTRGFKVTITDNGTPLQIQNSAEVWFNCENLTPVIEGGVETTKKASVEGTVNTDGTVTVFVPSVVMEVAGNIQSDISIITTTETNNELTSQVLKTMTFMLDCQKAANPAGTSSTAEDDILVGLASGTIVPPAGNYVPYTRTVAGLQLNADISAGALKEALGVKDITYISAETVPDSVHWNGVIPNTYAGETGEDPELAYWYEFGTFWLLHDITGDEYEWVRFAFAHELDFKEAKSNKVSVINDTNKNSDTLYPSVKAVVDYSYPVIETDIDPLGYLGSTLVGKVGQIAHYSGNGGFYVCYSINNNSSYTWKILPLPDSDTIEGKYTTTGPSGNYIITSTKTLYEIWDIFSYFHVVKVRITDQYHNDIGAVCYITSITGMNREKISAVFVPAAGGNYEIEKRIHVLEQIGDSSSDTLNLVTKYTLPAYSS